jgi:hypothetical protein
VPLLPELELLEPEPVGPGLEPLRELPCPDEPDTVPLPAVPVDLTGCALAVVSMKAAMTHVPETTMPMIAVRVVASRCITRSRRRIA